MVKIRIPLLLLGPYLRPFLVGSIVVTGALTAGLVVACSLVKAKDREDYLLAIRASGASFIIFVATFVLLWLLGMP